ncbi:hypothetical protein [Vallitalea guaymasensis]|uniref:hypothetical protein n=1 Tax=Vallitalea guaymasensis TaxID=1185412 RepID=UPI00187D4A7E|nr:hypothetical protein [Vallitalea guaymasensis]
MDRLTIANELVDMLKPALKKCIDNGNYERAILISSEIRELLQYLKASSFYFRKEKQPE